MARKILCESCFHACAKFVKENGEFFETIKGKAIKKMNCDDGGEDIDIGDTAYAAILLDKKREDLYKFQAPEKWAPAYIDNMGAPEVTK